MRQEVAALCTPPHGPGELSRFKLFTRRVSPVVLLHALSRAYTQLIELPLILQEFLMSTANTVDTESSRTVGRLAGSAHEAIDKAGAGLSSAEQRVRATASGMNDALHATTRRTRLQGERVLKSVRDYAGGYPLISLGVALGAGWLLASAMRFMRR
jgi:hypothetical protein